MFSDPARIQLKLIEALIDQAKPASLCYERKGYNFWDVLERGSADFDEKFDPNDANEETHYRADLYASTYMMDHFPQCRLALQACFGEKFPQPLLFVDYGCGPMTAGFALAKLLLEQKQKLGDYRANTVYMGIDASKNMVKKAVAINDKFELFDKDHFKAFHHRQFDPQEVPPAVGDIGKYTAVLMLSFVLAPRTLQPEKEGESSVATAEKLAKVWRSYNTEELDCREKYVIYMNPQQPQSHWHRHTFDDNYKKFTQILLDNENNDGWIYSDFNPDTSKLPKRDDVKDFTCGLIKGKYSEPSIDTD